MEGQGLMVSGRAAIVTGASRGIGRAIALELGRSGDFVVVNYAGREEEARHTARLIEEAGGAAIVARGDVSIASDARRLVESALAAFGRLDVIVNNAGVTRDGLLVRMKDDDWDAVLDVNLRGAFHLIRAGAKQMMKQRYGRIVNITSVVGVTGNAGQANYVSAKAGLIGLTKAAARELGARNITVNAVAPGYIKTEMTASLSEDILTSLRGQIPLGQVGSPEQVARAVRFLASDEADYITGQVLHVDGGMVM